jgi:hypothetical protein
LFLIYNIPSEVVTWDVSGVEVVDVVKVVEGTLEKNKQR